MSSPSQLLEEALKSFPDRVLVGKEKYVMWKNYLEDATEIENFEIRPDDTWVIGFPKTGTTWLQEMVWCIKNNLNFEYSKSTSIDDRFPILELITLSKKNPGEISTIDPINYCKNMKSPRFIKTHLGWSLIPKQLRTGEVKPKMIYIWREPKDTTTSLYKFMTSMDYAQCPFDVLCEMVVSDQVPKGPFWTHVNSFLKRQNLPNLLILTYEEMKADLKSCIKKTASFLETTLSDEQVEALAKHLSYDSMKENKSVGVRLLYGKEVPFLGTGKTGSYKSMMTEEMVERFDEWSKQNQLEKDEINLSFDEE